MNRTRTGAARKLRGSLSSLAVTANEAVYVVLVFIGSWATSRTSPPRLLTDQSNRSPPGLGDRVKAVTKEARSTRSVHTNQMSRVVLWPAAPSLGKLTRRPGGVESIVKTAALVSMAVFPAGSMTVTRTRTVAESTLGSVHENDPPPTATTMGPTSTVEKPSAPPSSEYDRRRTREASSGSVETHWML